VETEKAGLKCHPDGDEGTGGGRILSLNQSPQVRRKKRRGK
jgi:hypothetical protein